MISCPMPIHLKALSRRVSWFVKSSSLPSFHLESIFQTHQFLASLEPSLVKKFRPLAFSSSGIVKLIRLQWVPSDDSWFILHTCLNRGHQQLHPHQRLVSSLIAQIFGPLRFTAPVIIRAKILLQDLWREGKGWDDPIAPELGSKFCDYYSNLKNLARFKVPRSYFCDKISICDLFSISDATNRAFGAVIYLAAKYHSKPILVCAKSQVVHLKAVTFPQLELLGTVLLTWLMMHVCKVLKYNVTNTLFSAIQPSCLHG